MTTQAEAVKIIEQAKANRSLPRLGGACARGFLNSLTKNRELTARLIAANSPMAPVGDRIEQWQACCAAIDAGAVTID